MNTKSVLSQLAHQFPGKSIFKNDEQNPTEIIIEIEPTSEHPEYSNTIAVIDKSIPHYHKILTETYTVTRGTLKVHIEDETFVLKEGESLTIQPGKIHWAEGNETWIECYSEPGWTPEDHIIIEAKKEFSEFNSE